MKIRFTGCGNRGQEHTFDFRPWYGRFYLGSPPYRLLREKGGHPGSPGTPAHWILGRFVPGKLEGLKLGGDNYEVTLVFEDAELKNWLKDYIKHKPDEALDLIAEMLPEALKSSRTHQKAEKTCQNKP